MFRFTGNTTGVIAGLDPAIPCGPEMVAWKDHRDCHIRPDLILIYRKPDHESFELVRLGSHNELGF